MADSFTYDIDAIQDAVNNLDETTMLSSNRLIYCQVNHSDEYSASDITALTANTSDIINVSNRLKLYVDIINSNLSSFNDLFDTQKFTLYSRPFDILFNDGMMQLTGYHKDDQPRVRTCILTTFFRNCCSAQINPNISLCKKDVTLESHDYQQFFDNISNLDSKIYDCQLLCRSTSDIHNKIYARDIYAELDSFVVELEKIKRVSTTFVFLRNNLSSTAAATYKSFSDIEDDTAEARRKSQVFITPYSIAASPADNDITDKYSTQKLKEDTTVELSYLVKEHSKIATLTSTFPSTFEHSNGVFSFNSQIVSKDVDLRSLISFESYGLQSGQIISRKRLLSLIDCIFNTWLTNIASIHYTCHICHENCHSNYIYLNVLAQDRRNTCCYCGYCTRVSTT